MIRVTVDTNVLVSATYWSGSPLIVMELVGQRKLCCILSNEILEEYDRVINSDEIVDKVENKGLVASRIIDKVVSDCIIVEPKVRLEIVKDDPSDNKILECAVAGSADYLITSDAHLLGIKEFMGVRIVRPKDFLDILL